MKKILCVSLLFALSACSVTPHWAAVGGSRSDGTVQLAYDLGELEHGEASEAEGVQIAAQRCQAWGYTSAQAFGGSLKQCLRQDGLGLCTHTRITREYQCTTN